MGADDAQDKQRALRAAAAFRGQGDYAAAAAVLEEQLRRAPGVELLAAADEVIQLGIRAGELDAVLSLARTMWAFLRAVQGDRPPIVERATTVMLLAERLGQGDLARQMAEYVLRARRGYLPDRHPDLVLAMNDSARHLLAAGAVEAARALYEEVAGSLPGEGPHDSGDAAERASAHCLLGELCLRLGEGEAAATHWTSALAWAELLADGRSVSVAAHLGLGRLHLTFADVSGAARHLEQAYELTRPALGAPGPAWPGVAADAAATADLLLGLGAAHRRRHDALGAERALQEAIDLNAALGRRRSVAEAVVALGHAYQVFDELGAAERHYAHALSILDELEDQEPQLRFRILSNLGALREQQGRLDEARDLLAEATALLTEEIPPQNRVALLNNRGRLAFKSHRDHEAVLLYRQSVDACRAGEGDQADLQAALFNLAEALLALGDRAGSVQAFREGLGVEDARLWSILSTGSQREWLAAASAAQFRVDQLLDLALSSDDRYVVESAADVLLNRAGLTAAVHLIQYEIESGADSDPRIGELRQERTRLKTAIEARKLGGPPTGASGHRATGPVEDQLHLEAVESELSARVFGGSGGSGGSGARAFGLRWQRIVEALPADTALVDLRRYRPFDYAVEDRTNSMVGEARYAALVLRRDRTPVLLALGAAGPIDAAAVDAVAAFSGLRPADAAAVSALRTAVVDPLLPHLAGARTVLISPDGELNRLPFEAIPLEGDRLLMDEFEVGYLSTARDVLRIGAPLPPAGPPLVVADPDLDLGTAPGRPPAGAGPAFGALPAARAEAEEVAALLGVLPVLGGAAVKRSVTGAHGPSVLHIATHGFFLPGTRQKLLDSEAFEVGRAVQVADPERRTMSLDGILATPIGFTAVPDGPFRRLSGEGLDDPMLRSGLALAGANTWLAGGEPPHEAENGLVTAADLAVTDLSTTRLVVLSACDTALGETRTGEGVFGMRRAVSLAGARSLVMSLWKVPDKQTRELMGEFYARLMTGEGVGAALTAAREVQRRKYPHPVYWAAFVCQGDLGPVRLDRSTGAGE